MYAEILAIFMSSVVELLISGYLGLKAPESFLASKVISWWFLAIPVVLLPGIFVWIFRKSISEIKEEQFKLKFGPLMQQINLKYKANLSYYFIFVLRRCIFVLIAVIFESYPIL